MVNQKLIICLFPFGRLRERMGCYLDWSARLRRRALMEVALFFKLCDVYAQWATSSCIHPSLHLHIACEEWAPGEKQICASSGALFPPADFQQLARSPAFFWAGPSDNGNTPTALFQDRARRKNEPEPERAMMRDKEQKFTVAPVIWVLKIYTCSTAAHCGTRKRFILPTSPFWMALTKGSVVCAVMRKNPCMRLLARSTRRPHTHARARAWRKTHSFAEENGMGKSAAAPSFSLFKYSHIAPLFLWDCARDELF
jgi:hypothetical protein